MIKKTFLLLTISCITCRPLSIQEWIEWTAGAEGAGRECEVVDVSGKFREGLNVGQGVENFNAPEYTNRERCSFEDIINNTDSWKDAIPYYCLNEDVDSNQHITVEGEILSQVQRHESYPEISLNTQNKTVVLKKLIVEVLLDDGNVFDICKVARNQTSVPAPSLEDYIRPLLKQNNDISYNHNLLFFTVQKDYEGEGLGVKETGCLYSEWHEWSECSMSCLEDHVDMGRWKSSNLDGYAEYSVDGFEISSEEYKISVELIQQLPYQHRFRDFIYIPSKPCRLIEEIRLCDETPPCDGYCHLTEWESYISHSVGNEGKQVYRRSIIKYDKTCEKFDLEKQEFRPPTTTPGNECTFQPWTNWTGCSAPCFDPSHPPVRYRSRLPQNEKLCEHETQQEFCDTTDMEPCLLEGRVSDVAVCVLEESSYRTRNGNQKWSDKDKCICKIEGNRVCTAAEVFNSRDSWEDRWMVFCRSNFSQGLPSPQLPHIPLTDSFVLHCPTLGSPGSTYTKQSFDPKFCQHNPTFAFLGEQVSNFVLCTENSDLFV